ncbi:MAG: hypothetical protein V2A70_07400 [Candidatus Omnitrophota bacterium]
MQKIFGVICWVIFGVNQGVWAQDTQAPEWGAPLVQEVRMPAGVQTGVYYPAHDEWVMVKPGSWNMVKPLKDQGTGSKDPAVSPTVITAKVMLAGHLKLSEAVKSLAQANGLDVVMGAGVEDKLMSVNFKDISTDEALKRLLSSLGYGFKVQDGVVFVLARETRAFSLSLPPVTQTFTTITNNESSNASTSKTVAGNASGEGHVRVGARVQVENASQGLSYWQDMEENIKSLMSSHGVVSFNRSAGMFLVTDTPVVLDQISTFVDTMNARAAQQIRVDVKVVEVTLSKEHQLGIDWGALASAGSLKAMGLTTNFASENMVSGNMMTFTARADKETSGDTSSGVKAVLKALESFGRVDMVSQPRLMMLNNSVASIQVGETKSYVESSDTQTTSSGGTLTSATLNEVHGGVTLQIIGSLVGEDIFLNVTPVVSTIDSIRTITLGGGSKLEAPETSIKTMSTQVRVKAGQTVAIGGLITQEGVTQRQGVPFLSRIPVLGKAFSYEVRRRARSELVIFMTPTKG